MPSDSDSDYTSSEEDPRQIIQRQKKDLHYLEQIIANSPERIVRFGLFHFNLDKIKPFMDDSQIVSFFSKWRSSQNIENAQIETLAPHKIFYGVHSYSGKSFNPSKKSMNRHSDFPLIKAMTQINFTNLTNLNLSKQKITSVEDLTFLDIPKLTCLELYGNCIYSLEPLHKADFKQLQRFYRIHNKKLQKYEFDNNQKADSIVEDYRFLFKMEGRKIKSLTVRDPERINIKGQKLFNILNQPGTEIHFHIIKIVRRNMLRNLTSD